MKKEEKKDLAGREAAERQQTAGEEELRDKQARGEATHPENLRQPKTRRTPR